MRHRFRITTLMAPPVVWLVALFLVPLAIMSLYSFRTGTVGAIHPGFSFDTYRAYLANAGFQRLLWQSALIAFETAFITVVLSYPVAYFLAYGAGSRRLIFLTVLIVPAWTSFLLRVLAWTLLLGSGGVLNTLLLSLGLVKEALPILLYSRTAVVVTLVYSWIPFVTLPIFAALERIDRNLLEASADLGCAPWETFLRITLPLSLPGVLAGFFFTFIPTLGEWVTPSLVGGAQGVMYGNLIQDQFVRALNWPMGSLMSLVMLAAVLILLFIFSRLVPLADLAGL